VLLLGDGRPGPQGDWWDVRLVGRALGGTVVVCVLVVPVGREVPDDVMDPGPAAGPGPPELTGW